MHRITNCTLGPLSRLQDFTISSKSTLLSKKIAHKVRVFMDNLKVSMEISRVERIKKHRLD